MSKMKREFEEQLTQVVEQNYRQAGLTDETIERIARWIQNAEPTGPTCKCTNCACGKSKED